MQVAAIFTTYNGIKILDYQLPYDLTVHMLQRPDCKIIFLRRKNLLQSVVSVLIAEQTHLWKVWDMTKPLEYYRNLQPLDIQDIQGRVRELKHRLGAFESVIDLRPGDEVIKLTYEDLFFSDTQQQKEKIAAIWDLLNLASLEFKRFYYYLRPEAVKLNSAETYSRLPNVNEIQKHCGNDETGRLFE